MGALPDHDLIDVNLGDESGYTPLYVAATAGTVSIVNLLLAGGANIGISTKRNKTALYAAVEKGTRPPPFGPPHTSRSRNCVCVCVCSGNRRVVAALLPKCTCEDLRKRTNYGTDVLHIADRNGNRVIKGVWAPFVSLLVIGSSTHP